MALPVDVLTHKSEPVDINVHSLSLEVGDKLVLDSVTARFLPGTVTAIMGPSGSGKSSLIAAMLGKASYGRTTGQVFINFREEKLSHLRDIIGYVPQDHILLPELTIRETLLFSAKRRLPASYSTQRKEEIVDSIIRLLELEDHQHQLVGDSEDRGISGGQKARVNIGVELVADPTVVILDEPTSGLDSSTCEAIVRSLKQIASLGATVIMIIHQPRSEVFNLFDNVLLMAPKGRVAFFGSPKTMEQYFRHELLLECPKQFNPADFYMDAVVGKLFATNGELVEPPELVVKWHSPEAGHRYYEETASAKGAANTHSNRHLPGKIKQTGLIFWRTLIQTWRKRATFLSDCIMMLLAGGVVGALYRNPSLGDITDVSFMVMLTTSLAAVQQGLRIFGEERLVFWREAGSGLSTLAYFIAKNLASFVQILLMPLLFLFTFFWVYKPFMPFGFMYVILMLSQAACHGIGQVVSLVCKPTKAILVGVVCSLLLSVVCGFNPTMPQLDGTWVGKAAYTISFSRYVWEFLVCAELRWAPHTTPKEIASRQTILDHFGLDLDNGRLDPFFLSNRCLIALVIMFFALRVVAYIAMTRLNRSRLK